MPDAASPRVTPTLEPSHRPRRQSRGQAAWVVPLSKLCKSPQVTLACHSGVVLLLHKLGGRIRRRVVERYSGDHCCKVLHHAAVVQLLKRKAAASLRHRLRPGGVCPQEAHGRPNLIHSLELNPVLTIAKKRHEEFIIVCTRRDRKLSRVSSCGKRKRRPCEFDRSMPVQQLTRAHMNDRAPAREQRAKTRAVAVAWHAEAIPKAARGRQRQPLAARRSPRRLASKGEEAAINGMHPQVAIVAM